jgi:ADP-ribosyl-[dinitrogen reductase] hydrolase
MRLAPIPVYFHSKPSLAIEHAALQSRITHGSRFAVESCQLATAQIIGFLQESEETSPQEKKRRVLAPDFLPAGVDKLLLEMEEVKNLRSGTWKEKTESEINTRGFVIASHEAALWALWSSENFEEVVAGSILIDRSRLTDGLQGMLRLLTMGNDVDTVCAIYGQLAGACYGIEAIPSRWLKDVRPKEMLDDVFGTLVKIVVE